MNPFCKEAYFWQIYLHFLFLGVWFTVRLTLLVYKPNIDNMIATWNSYKCLLTKQAFFFFLQLDVSGECSVNYSYMGSRIIKTKENCSNMEIGGDFSGAKKVTVFHFLPNINDLKLIKNIVFVLLFLWWWFFGLCVCVFFCFLITYGQGWDVFLILEKLSTVSKSSSNIIS